MRAHFRLFLSDRMASRDWGSTTSLWPMICFAVSIASTGSPRTSGSRDWIGSTFQHSSHTHAAAAALARIGTAGRCLRCSALGVPAGFLFAAPDAAARYPLVKRHGGCYRLQITGGRAAPSWITSYARQHLWFESISLASGGLPILRL